MVVDIYKVITSNPITKGIMSPWGSNSKANSLRRKLFNKYTGPGNDQEIYNIDNYYKKYFPNLYLELLGIYNLSDLSKLIYRKNNYNKIECIIKLLKEKNVDLKNYREESKKFYLLLKNIKNYSLYIDEKYLNKK